MDAYFSIRRTGYRMRLAGCDDNILQMDFVGHQADVSYRGAFAHRDFLLHFFVAHHSYVEQEVTLLRGEREMPVAVGERGSDENVVGLGDEHHGGSICSLPMLI